MAFVRVRDDEVDPEPVKDPGQSRPVEVDAERRDENPMHEAGEIATGGLDAVVGEDRDPRLHGRRGEEKARQRAQPPVDRPVGPLRDAGIHRPEQQPFRVVVYAHRKQVGQRVARRADCGERRFGPAIPPGAIWQRLQELRSPGQLEIPAPDVGTLVVRRLQPCGCLRPEHRLRRRLGRPDTRFFQRGLQAEQFGDHGCSRLGIR